MQVLRKEGRQAGTGRYGVYLGGVYLSLLGAELPDQPGRLEEWHQGEWSIDILRGGGRQRVSRRS